MHFSIPYYCSASVRSLLFPVDTTDAAVQLIQTLAPPSHYTAAVHHQSFGLLLSLKAAVCCAGCVGTEECGVLFTVRLPKVVRSATLSYKVKFDADYDWTRGGKLPGLCDEDCPTGCVSKQTDGGWSGRVHFRPDGDLTSYMYLPGGDETCGRDVFWGVQAQSNKWMTLKIFYLSLIHI